MWDRKGVGDVIFVEDAPTRIAGFALCVVFLLLFVFAVG